MRFAILPIVILVCCRAFAEDKSPSEVEKLQAAGVEARKGAAADPTITSRQSKPVLAYLIEQKLRRSRSVAGLKQRIEQYEVDENKKSLVPVLAEQLAELERKPLDQVGFDGAYGYSPATGLVGYSKKVRLIENREGGKSVILVDNAALVLEGLGTSQYASGKFFNIDKAILIGTPLEETLFQGTKRKTFSATLVDLEAMLKAPADAKPGAATDGARTTPVAAAPNRPKVPGTLRLTLRERRAAADSKVAPDSVQVVERQIDWQAAETAVIVCDMWNDHHCKIAAQRVGVMAPRMNQALTAARDRGVMIIHAPSETMDVYAGTLYRARMQQAKHADPPTPIQRRSDRDPKLEPPTLPVDTNLDCDDAVPGPVVRFHTRQHAAIDIVGFDGVSDNGEEIYNFFRQEGIRNVVLMGVHTNYCIVARSFGIRQMVRLGMNVVLARDLTDALYDPREPPYVSHARGTEIVVEHIERHLCPSIVSVDLTRVVAGSDGPLARGMQTRTSDSP